MDQAILDQISLLKIQRDTLELQVMELEYEARELDGIRKRIDADIMKLIFPQKETKDGCTGGIDLLTGGCS